MIRRSAALALAVLLATGVAAPALAAEPTVGADVSRYQCGRPWAGAQDFAVVAVNTGVPTGTNPCLEEQLTLAALSPGDGHPAVSVYVNTANPKPSAASWWPTGDRTRRDVRVRSPYGPCTGGASRACSWVYGASLALDDLETRGVPRGLPARWWLDVEAANSWSPSTARNRAVLEGMTAQLQQAGERVGLYALDHEFRDLIGAVPDDSPLAPLPSWLAGGGDQAHAARICARAPLTRGRVLLAQWVVVSGTDRLDADLACTTIARAPKPKVVGTRAVGARLTARTGRWDGDVALAYRWTRDGETVPGATKATYRVRASDAGHRLAVVITGTRDGSSRAVRTSAAARVPRQ